MKVVNDIRMSEVNKKRIALEFFIELIISVISLAAILIIIFLLDKIGIIGLLGLIFFSVLEIIDFIFTYRTVKKDPVFLSSLGLTL